MTPLTFWLIATAAITGSLIGSFARPRLSTAIWTVPAVAMLLGAIMFAAPRLEGRTDVPPLLREVLLTLADPAVALEMLVAAVAAGAVAVIMLRYVLTSRAASPGDFSGRAPRTPVRRMDNLDQLNGDAPSPAARARAMNEAPARSRYEPPRAADLPVYEIAPVAPLQFTAADLEEAAPSPPPALFDAVANRRAQPRRRSALAGRLLLADGSGLPCGIQNLSVNGARVKMAEPVRLPGDLTLLDLTHWLAHEVEVKWQTADSAGVRFKASYDLNRPHNDRTRQLRQICADLAPR